MASTAHAFFCFEVLAASYQEEEHPDLQTLLDTYDSSQPSNHTLPINSINTDGAGGDAQPAQDQNPPQPPSITRLQSLMSKSRSEASTPSTRSVNSSTSQLTTSTATSITTPPSYASLLSVNKSYPLFVTWNTLSRSGHNSLRGCIGTFEGLPLEKGLKQYALTSAFEDTRFSPISVAEIPRLSCSLTLLADFEQCATPMDWTLGTHGIRISFTHSYRRHGATYLPDVAVEQGWSKEETLESLMRKAGWEGSSRRAMRTNFKPWEEVKDFRVVRYTGLKASASYQDWQDWRRTTKLAAVAVNVS